MTALAYAALVVWLATLAYMATGAWSAARGKHVRRGDPMRLACFITAAVFVGYILRGLFWPGEVTSGAALRLASMADAIYIIALGRTYGRGERV